MRTRDLGRQHIVLLLALPDSISHDAEPGYFKPCRYFVVTTIEIFTDIMPVPHCMNTSQCSQLLMDPFMVGLVNRDPEGFEIPLKKLPPLVLL